MKNERLRTVVDPLSESGRQGRDAAKAQWLASAMRCTVALRVLTYFEAHPGLISLRAAKRELRIGGSEFHGAIAFLKQNQFVVESCVAGTRRITLAPIPPAPQARPRSFRGSKHGILLVHAPDERPGEVSTEQEREQIRKMKGAERWDHTRISRTQRFYSLLRGTDGFFRKRDLEDAFGGARATTAAYRDLTSIGAMVEFAELVPPVLVLLPLGEACDPLALVELAGKASACAVVDEEPDRLVHYYRALLKLGGRLPSESSFRDRAVATRLLRTRTYDEMKPYLTLFVRKPAFFHEPLRNAIARYGPTLLTFELNFGAIVEACREESLAYRQNPNGWWDYLAAEEPAA